MADGATGAATAAAAAARKGATTAQISLALSSDLPRRARDGAPKKQKPKHSPTPHNQTTHEAPNVSDVTEPITPGQDDDPDRIDDVV